METTNQSTGQDRTPNDDQMNLIAMRNRSADAAFEGLSGTQQARMDAANFSKIQSLDVQADAVGLMVGNAKRSPEYADVAIAELGQVDKRAAETVQMAVDSQRGYKSIEKSMEETWASVPKDGMSLSEAAEAVKKDIESMTLVRGEDRFFAAANMADLAQDQKNYQAELQRQAPELAKEVEAAGIESARRSADKEDRKAGAPEAANEIAFGGRSLDEPQKAPSDEERTALRELMSRHMPEAKDAPAIVAMRDADAFTKLDNDQFRGEAATLILRKAEQDQEYRHAWQTQFPQTFKEVGQADELSHQQHKVRSLEADPNQPRNTGPVLQKSGYEIPKHIESQFVSVDGKFFAKDKPDRAVFEDKGRSLATANEDKATIASMVDIAKAKGWEQLELKGSESFRRTAWLEAESQGIKTKGFKPKDNDLAALEAMRQERATNQIGVDPKTPKEQAATAPAKDVPTLPLRDAIQVGQQQGQGDGTKPAPALSAADSIKIEGARKVFEEAIAKQNPLAQKQARERFEAGIKKMVDTGRVDLPTPKVKVTEQARVVPQGERTR